MDRFDFCGVGNAGLDIIDEIDDDFIRNHSLIKGNCIYLTLAEAKKLENALKNPQYPPGGCAANVASCVALLGGRSAFMGRVADDDFGKTFAKDLETSGIHYPHTPIKSTAEKGSTRIFCLTTPDAERSFASYYGVQEDLDETDINLKIIEDSFFYYIDGYALNSKRGKDVFLTGAKHARKHGRTVVLSPNDLSILTKYKGAIDALIPASDMILCNASEAFDITKTSTMNDALNGLKKMFKGGAVTDGGNGVYVFDHAAIHHLPVVTPPAAVIDTNGAGDNFAGGFLYGLSRGYDLPKAAMIGLYCASAVITHFGARIDDADLKWIKQKASF